MPAIRRAMTADASIATKFDARIDCHAANKPQCRQLMQTTLQRGVKHEWKAWPMRAVLDLKATVGRRG